MKGLRRFYKNNRVYVILMVLSIVCILSIFIGVIVYFAKQSTQDVYGDRLDGIENVKLTDDRFTEMENAIKESELVSNVDVTLQGKIIYAVVKLNGGTPQDAENISVKMLEKLSEEEKLFYDIQFIFTLANESEESVFPIMGYKKSSNTTISWTKYSS